MSFEQAREVVDTYKLAGLLETSAKSGLNVEQAFREFSQLLLRRAREMPPSVPLPAQKLDNRSEAIKRKKKCC